MGWNASFGSVCSPYVPVGEGNCIDWALVTADEYDALLPLVKVYNAAEALYQAIKEYKDKGFADTAAAEDVYLNEEATVKELEKALEDLTNAFLAWNSAQASVEHPADMTSKIVNYSFDSANLSGWSGTEWGRGGTVSDGAEHYDKTYDTYQKIEGLTPGIYLVGVNGFYRAGNYGGEAEKHWMANDEASKYAKFYAQSGENTYEAPVASVLSGYQTESKVSGAYSVTIQDEDGNDIAVYVPNTMAVGDYYFHTLGQYANKLYAVVDESGELTIGVKKSEKIDGDWSMFDDFSLTFYGNGTDAVQLFANEAWTYEPMELDEEEVLYTESYLTAYNSLVAAYDPAGVTTVESFLEQKAVVDAAYEALQKNIDLWKQLQNLYDKRSDYSYAYAGTNSWNDLDDVYYDEVEPALDYVNLTNEELQALVDKINALIAECEKEIKNLLQDGDDMTKYITNADLMNGKEGWTTSSEGGNFQAGGFNDYKVFEAWHATKFNFSQEITDPPIGVYELSAQGYVRYLDGSDAIDKRDNRPDYINIFIYMNDAKTYLPNWLDYPQEIGFFDEFNATLTENGDNSEKATYLSNGEGEYPDNRTGAAACFAKGDYTVSAFGLVANPGETFTVGIKGEDLPQDYWPIWGQFKLTYRAFNADVVRKALETALVSIDPSQPMAKSLYEKASELNTEAEKLMAGEDGKAMFNVLKEVYAIASSVTESVQIFNELSSAVENLETIASESSSSKKAEALALVDEIVGHVKAHDIENADAESYMEKINVMITLLALPDDIDVASDTNPIELNVIVNPSYEEGLDGWSGTAAAWNEDATDAEIFGKDFDYYQEISGLPAGTYQVSVQAFYRSGTAVDDYNTLDSLNTTHAFLYGAAIQGTDTVMNAKPLQRLGAIVNFEGYEFKGISDEEVTDYAVVVTDTIDKGTDNESYLRTFVPNMMNTANDAFLNGWFSDNVVTIKLAEGETLRIGLLKETLLTNDWTIFDNWKLTYFGKNSTKEATGDNATAIRTLAGEGETVKVEFFTLDGRRAGAAQKGLIIVKQTLDDGSVIVKKIRK